MSPSLDHFIGRQVVAIEQVAHGEWELRLEGDVIVRNLGREDWKSVEDAVGESLLKVDHDEDGDFVSFGISHADRPAEINHRLKLTRYEYTISVPDGGDPNDELSTEDALPPDPSAERVVDGPVEAPEKPAEVTDG